MRSLRCAACSARTMKRTVAQSGAGFHGCGRLTTHNRCRRVTLPGSIWGPLATRLKKAKEPARVRVCDGPPHLRGFFIYAETDRRTPTTHSDHRRCDGDDDPALQAG